MKKADSKLSFKTKPLFAFKRPMGGGGSETDPTTITITMTSTIVNQGFKK
jgi:hypothetical protein